jgi:hypothetical protein
MKGTQKGKDEIKSSLFLQMIVILYLKDCNNDGGANATMLNCKNFCKCHIVPPAQQLKQKDHEDSTKNALLFAM